LAGREDMGLNGKIRYHVANCSIWEKGTKRTLQSLYNHLYNVGLVQCGFQTFSQLGDSDVGWLTLIKFPSGSCSEIDSIPNDEVEGPSNKTPVN